MVLLIFAWGLGPVLQKMARRPDAVMGTVRGEEVTDFDLHVAGNTLRVAMSLSFLGDFALLVFDDRPEVNDDTAWRFVLLLREAEATGIETTLGEVRDALAASPSLSDGVGISAGRFRAFLRGYNLTEGQVKTAVEQLLSVAKLVDLHRFPVATTNAELWAAYRLTARKVSAEYVIVEAEWFEDLVEAEPDALAEFHEQYKDQEPDTGQGTPGYLAPPRVRVECARPAMARLKAAAVVQEEEIAAYYEEHKEEFLVEEEAAPEAEADDAEDAEPVYRGIDDVRELIRDILATQRARERADELIESAMADLREIGADFAREPLPLARMARRHDLEYRVLTTDGDREFLSRQELQQAISLGMDVASSGMDVASFAFAETDNLYQPRRFAPSGEADGAGVICQVLERRPEEPQPYDEVSDQVRRDYVAREALAKAETFADQVRERASEAGLAAAAEELRGRLANLIGGPAPPEGADADDLLTVAETGLFGQSDFPIEGLDGWHPAFTEAALRLTGGEVAVARESTPSSRCYVLRVTGDEAPAAESFADARPILERAYLYGKQAQALADWMDGLEDAATRVPGREEN